MLAYFSSIQKILLLLGIVLFVGLANSAQADTVYEVGSCADLQALDDAAPYVSTDQVYLTASFSCDTVIGDVSDFTGTFDGRGYTITLTGNSALFDTLDGATVRNLMIAGDIDGGGSAYVSALASIANNGTLIEQVGVIANLTNVSSYSAGFVYRLSDSTIQDSFHTGTVTGTGSYVSGFAAFMIDGSIIQRVFSEGAITGASYVGGIAGFMDRVGAPQVVRDSFFAGSITSTNSLGAAIAGLVDNAFVPDLTLWLDNNYYDDDSVDPSVCAQSTPDILSQAGVCEAINTIAEPDPFYFLENNINEPMVSWEFNTVWFTQAPHPRLRALSGPSILSLSPLDNATDVETNFDIEITFDQNVAFDSGTITIHQMIDDQAVVTIPVGGGGFAAATSVSFLETLDNNTEYYINISDGAFINDSDLNFLGINNSTTWNFTTAAASLSSQRSSGNKVRFGCRDTQADNFDRFTRHNASLCSYASAEGPTVISTFVETPSREIALLYPGILLREGSQGPSVVLIQERLSVLMLDMSIDVDGIFGFQTDSAIKLFQESQGLIPDGIVGPQTWNKMFASINS